MIETLTNGDRPKFVNNFSKNENFQRKLPGRNNHNASKLIENTIISEKFIMETKSYLKIIFNTDHFAQYQMNKIFKERIRCQATMKKKVSKTR